METETTLSNLGVIASVRGSVVDMPNPKSKKRDNIFPKSRDLREERGTREMKTSHNDQTLHAR